MSSAARAIAANIKTDSLPRIVEARCGTFDAVAGRRVLGRFANAQAALQAAIVGGRG